MEPGKVRSRFLAVKTPFASWGLVLSTSYLGRDSALGAWVRGGRIAGSDANGTHSWTGTRDRPTRIGGTPNADLFTQGGGGSEESNEGREPNLGRDSALRTWVRGGRIAGSDANGTHSWTGTRDGPTRIGSTPNADLSKYRPVFDVCELTAVVKLNRL